MVHTTARVALAGAVGAALAVVPTTTAAAASASPASGAFAVTAVLAPLTFEPARGNKCQVTVTGVLSFTGTLAGDAVGTTTAYVFAPCSEVQTSLPGTQFDVFRFDGQFTGTVAGTPVEAPLSYSGVTRPGGDIDASIRVKDGAMAVLRAQARVLVGGTYDGVAKG